MLKGCHTLIYFEICSWVTGPNTLRFVVGGLGQTSETDEGYHSCGCPDSWNPQQGGCRNHKQGGGSSDKKHITRRVI